MPRSREARARATVEEAAGQLIPLDVKERFLAEVRRRPVRSLAVAVAAGYLAGGGIGTILTARLLAIGFRIGVRAALIPVLADGVERALFPSRADGDLIDRLQTKQANQKEMHS